MPIAQQWCISGVWLVQNTDRKDCSGSWTQWSVPLQKYSLGIHHHRQDPVNSAFTRFWFHISIIQYVNNSAFILIDQSKLSCPRYTTWYSISLCSVTWLASLGPLRFGVTAASIMNISLINWTTLTKLAYRKSEMDWTWGRITWKTASPTKYVQLQSQEKWMLVIDVNLNSAPIFESGICWNFNFAVITIDA